MSGTGGNRRSLGLGRRNEEADGPVTRCEILFGDVFDLFGGDLLDAIAVDEVKTPVALRAPLAQLDGDSVGVCGGQLAVLEDSLTSAVRFLLCDPDRPTSSVTENMASRIFSSAPRSLVLTSAMISMLPGSWLADGLTETLVAFFDSTSAL